jgi:hypothetical protein
MSQHVGSDERFKVNTPTISHETIDNETLIIDLDSGSYYSLLGVGADVWSLVDRGASVETIVARMLEHYDAERGEIEPAVMNFLANLRQDRLIVAVPADEAQTAADVDLTPDTAAGMARRAFEAPVLTRHTDIQDLLLLCPVQDMDERVWPEPNVPTGD